MGPVLRLHESPAVDLSSAVAEFLADCRLRGLSPTTIQWYKYALGPFCRFAAAKGEAGVADVSERSVRAFLAKQAERVQPRRVNHYREAIYRFYEWLRTEDYVHANPAQRIGKVREPKKLIPAFTEQELQALLSQPDTRTFLGLRDHLFMLLLLDTGVRLSEALGLGLEDVDADGGTLKVLGKGSKERVVGFSPALERHLRRYMPRRDAALERIAAGYCPWLFPSQGGQKWLAKGVQMRLKRYGAQARITRVRVSPHTFRHTFALWFVKSGGSPFHLQKILGHTSLDISRRYCELADIDAVTKQQELSPLSTMRLPIPGGTRMR